MSDIKYIINDYGQFSFTNQQVIEQSKVFKEMQDDLGYLKDFPVSNNFTSDTINTYIECIDYINEKNQIISSSYVDILDLLDITSNFLEFLNYLNANNVIDIVSIYLNITNPTIVNKLNYDSKINICLSFDYNKFPTSLKYDPYFVSNWIGKKLHSNFKYYRKIGITDKFEYLDFKNSIIKGFNISRLLNKMYITFNSSRDLDIPLVIPDLNTYYDNRFLWNVIKNKLIVEESYIENIENIFFKNIPNYIDIYGNRIYNYDDVRGKLVQTIDDQWINLNYSNLQKEWVFKYISNDDKDQILYKKLSINKRNNKISIWVTTNFKKYHLFDNILKELEISKFLAETENDIDTKKLWSFIKNKLVIIEEDKFKMQEIIDYMNMISESMNKFIDVD